MNAQCSDFRGHTFGSIMCKTSLFYIADIDITITQQRVDGFSKSFFKMKGGEAGMCLWGRADDFVVLIAP